MYQTEPDIEDDFPTIMVLVYILNWVAWYRVLESFWLSLIVGSIVYLIGLLAYGIYKLGNS